MTQEELKDKILKACQKSGAATIPNDSLLNYIVSGVVSLPEMKKAGLDDDKVVYLSSRLEEKEIALWSETVAKDSVAAYNEYFTLSQLHHHDDEARDRINILDDKKWNEVQSILSENSLKEYLQQFPEGVHVNECRNLLNDLPWLETKRKNTIEDYNIYMQQNPGIHDVEALAAIHDIEDDNKWANTCILNTTSAYRDYVNQFPNGKHFNEAQDRLNSGAAGEYFLNALKADPNAFMASEIKQKVKNHVVSEQEVISVFGPDKAEAIINYQNPTPLPNAIAPDTLQPDTTEVYFWGTPGSGKTCALGTIISSAHVQGIIEPLQCEGLLYLNLLSNIFDDKGFCTLPDNTNVGNIQEMIINLTDQNKKQHRLTLIDLAGELFRSVFKSENNMPVPDENLDVLEKAMSYLKDRRNNKIHFFVVEYGAHDKKWDGLNMSNYLSHMIQYLKREKVFTKSTVGVYVLVTKCDKMPCSKNERPLYANEYVKHELAAFWNTLEMTCKDAAIKDLKTLSFSIGDVFAQQLCSFDGTDTDKVINKLLTKTPAINRRFGWLRS